MEQHKEDRLVYMDLFVGADSQERDKSINHQLAHAEWWQTLAAHDDNNNNNSSSTSSGDTGNTAKETS